MMPFMNQNTGNPDTIKLQIEAAKLQKAALDAQNAYSVAQQAAQYAANVDNIDKQIADLEASLDTDAKA